MAVSAAKVTVGTSPTFLTTAGEGGIAVYASSTGVFAGGATVTTASGIPLPATTIVTLPGARPRMVPVVPAVADDDADVYVVSQSGGQFVNYFTPGQ